MRIHLSPPVRVIALTAHVLVCLTTTTGVTFAAEGDPDPLFNGGQFRRIAFPGAGPGQALWAGSDAFGRVLIGGTSSDGEQDTLICLRLTTDGVLDPAYGSGGIARLPMHHAATAGHGMVVRSDGTVILAADGGGSLALDCLSASGALDSTYGIDGTVTVAAGTLGWGIFSAPGVVLAGIPAAAGVELG